MKKKPLSPEEQQMEKIVSLCKRRGFIFGSSEIYGGLSACYDYGPLGVEIKRNVKNAWWREMVTAREDIVGIDSAIIQHPKTWVASGHVEGFSDPLVECKECKKRYREDLLEERVCPGCGGTDFTEPREFNLMFKTHFGPVEDSAAIVYLRPETAQGIFLNFMNVLNTSRLKPPFGVAQMGKSFRNEITVEHFIFRSCEFEQMEMEFFCEPGSDGQWYDYWCQQRMGWWQRYANDPTKFRLRAHEPAELAHYAKACHDVEYDYPWGWGELEGVANRTDYDLRKHAEHSGQKLEYFDAAAQKKYVPYVIEPAAGATRGVLVLSLIHI